ncbi:MAG: phosphonate metabolism transcriptional regulator PhnF [Microcoleaceae cyanobacterium]
MNPEPLPIYAQIAQELRQNIQQGVYQAGDKLPTETQLTQRFQVNRNTIRKAIATLKSEGLLRVIQGQGTFVAETPIQYTLGKRVRYNQTLNAQGFEIRFQMLRSVEILADLAIASALEIQPEETVFLIERLSFANDQPISISTSYFPARHFPNLLSHQQQMWSISTLVRQIYGYDHIRRQTQVSARVVQPEDARLLKLPLNYPVLFVESININQNNTVIEYGQTRFRSDRMELVFDNEKLKE